MFFFFRAFVCYDDRKEVVARKVKVAASSFLPPQVLKKVGFNLSDGGFGPFLRMWKTATFYLALLYNSQTAKMDLFHPITGELQC